MKKKYTYGFFLIGLYISMHCGHHTQITKQAAGHSFVDQFPSYQCTNSLGKFDHCLRALCTLPKGVIVGSSDFVVTNNEYIASHELKEFRHVAIIGLKKNGEIQWGRVNGKIALVNHACTPNCELTQEGNVKTIQDIAESEELTIGYDTPIMGVDWNPKWNFVCWCKSSLCRNTIDSYDWSKKVRILQNIE